MQNVFLSTFLNQHYLTVPHSWCHKDLLSPLHCPRLTIAVLLAGLLLSLICKLQRVQNCAAHLVVHASLTVHTTPILAQLHWLPVQSRISYKITCLCFSSIDSTTPTYLSDILHFYSPARPQHSSADTCLLKLPLYKYKTEGDCAFSHFGLSVWNSLSSHIRNAATITASKSALKTHFFSLYHSG